MSDHYDYIKDLQAEIAALSKERDAMKDVVEAARGYRDARRTRVDIGQAADVLLFALAALEAKTTPPTLPPQKGVVLP